MVKSNLNVRQVAHRILMRVDKSGSFSHLLLKEVFEKEGLNEKDEALLTELVYGTIERQITLDYFIDHFYHSKKKLNTWVRVLLRLSVYQLYYLEKVPPYAVVNEAVMIAKKQGHQGISSLVNGILRSMIRKDFPKLDLIDDKTEYLSVKTSHPKWMIDRWIKNYGYELTKAMCQTNVTVKPMSVRVNSLKTTLSEVIKELEKLNIAWEAPKNLLKHGIIISDGNILKTNLIQEGYITIQDLSSMLVSIATDVAPSMKVLDTCSAPGGKVTYLAELMNNEGEIFAHDLHKNKISLVKNNAKRLGITNIRVSRQDARKLQEVYEENTFDRILIDAPCSGLGVIRSKPEIKYEKSLSDIKNLQKIQLNMLLHVSPLLKTTGKITYSTCTVEPLENEEVIKEFLKEQTTFKVDEKFLKEVKEWELADVNITEYGLQIFPHSMNSDGFFMTRLIMDRKI